MIRAIAIDDDPIATKVIELLCDELDYLTLEKTFNQSTSALNYLDQYPADLLFLDIRMPDLNGIELYKRIQQDTMVIFTTVHLEYAIEGFNLNAVDYLLKPYTEERFLQAVNKAREYYAFRNSLPEENKYLFVRADYSLIKINMAHILFIEGLDDYLKIHIQNQKPVVTRMTMKGIMEKLPSKEFIRIHRSYIVPLKRIEQLRNKVVHIAGHELALGTSYEMEFLKVFGK
ncbi:MAG: LytTR family DNA-binding domain-containing protein [Bacteroidota bacterium]|nr:LytTR family DNA-binding domain-containing protein [Bacteroidota bacterium]